VPFRRDFQDTHSAVSSACKLKCWSCVLHRLCCIFTRRVILSVCHVCVQDYIRKKNKWLVKIHEWVQANGGDPIIPFSGAFENEVRTAAMAWLVGQPLLCCCLCWRWRLSLPQHQLGSKQLL
jgi:hypothetical protein